MIVLTFWKEEILFLSLRKKKTNISVLRNLFLWLQNSCEDWGYKEAVKAPWLLSDIYIFTCI